MVDVWVSKVVSNVKLLRRLPDILAQMREHRESCLYCLQNQGYSGPTSFEPSNLQAKQFKTTVN
jgi:predicted xylose isomerase-like sugar epimerase